MRSRILLNGVWRFAPAEAGSESKLSPPADDSWWGLIRVPGSWWPARMRDAGVVASNPAWKLGKDSSAAWYERELEIPKEWAGRRILLDLQRVSTEARVFVNGKEAGTAEWPGGLVDLTPLVTPGAKTLLRLYVTASAQGTEFEFMGIGQDTVRRAELRQRGLIGDVWLLSAPKTPCLGGLFIQPSTRKKELAVTAEFEGLPQTVTRVRLSARAVPADGGEPVEFPEREADVTRSQDGAASARAVWPWENPRLWSPDTPHLYHLELRAQADGLDDTLRERFGFREFWIEGRKAFLNGVEIRPRTANISDGNGNPAAVDAAVALTLDRGIGLAWMWPENYFGRGRPFWQHLLADSADRQGLLLLGNLVRLNEYMRDAKFRDTWQSGREPWIKAMTREWRKYRNHPSIVGWILSGNVGPRHQDQNPRRIGTRGWSPQADLAALEDARGIMRALDPARTVVFGAAAYEGDIYTAMTYLNFIPLQEREEWLSEWARQGEMPYIAIEFGTPLHSSFMRGRMGFRPSGETEPLVAEFAAAYLGRKAYELESQRYRRAVRSRHMNGEKFSSFNFDPALETDPAFQEIQKLFIRNTWRAWRGQDAGWVSMIAWHTPQFFQPNPRVGDKDVASLFQPGQPGAFPDKLPAAELARSWRGPEFAPTGSGPVLLEAEAPTMAWIAGGPEEPADKTRHYRAGETLRKQIILVNDTLSPQPYRAAWSLTGLAEPKSGALEGEIPPGRALRLPVETALPAAVSAITPCAITLEARIGEASHQDTFAFDIFPAKPPATPLPPLAIWDPAGKTSEWLRRIGVPAAPWDGRPAPVLIVGREALSSGHKPPAPLETYTAQGGRLLIMTQQPEWLRQQLGLRVARQSLRQVWPVQENHPVMAGLKPEHLSCWSGSATLLEAKPEYPEGKFPEYGWRWGQRHVVSSAAIEKPHLAGWRPLLEGGFDLQYSPLLELDYGKGRVTLCALDFEDTPDPAAEVLARNILRHAATAPLIPRAARVIHIGNEASEKFLRSLGLVFESRPGLDGTAQLAVIASGAPVAQAAVDSFIQRGGRVLFLAHPKGGESHFGAPIVLKKNFSGSLNPPPIPEAAGLSPSDLRLKSDMDFRVIEGQAPGLEIFSDGLLAVRRLGRGAAVWCQLDPNILDADNKQYFRLTRWRHTRAITQLLANLGAQFQADSRVFRPHIERLPLAGEWKVRFTKDLPAVTWENKHPDPGISPLAQSLAAPGADETGFEPFSLPGNHPRFETVCGEALWRKTVTLPGDWAGQVLTINIPSVKSYDTVFWNGVPVGSTSKDTQPEDPWNLPRRYRVPGHLVKAGPNVIAIRQFAPDTVAGIEGHADKFFLRLISDKARPADLYHPDYRETFETGDEPARYYRW